MERIVFDNRLQQLITERGDKGLKIAFVGISYRYCRTILKRRLRWCILTCTYDTFANQWIPINTEQSMPMCVIYDNMRPYTDSLLWQRASQTLNLYYYDTDNTDRSIKNDITQMWSKENIVIITDMPKYISVRRYPFGHILKDTYLRKPSTETFTTNTIDTSNCDVILYNNPVYDGRHVYKYGYFPTGGYWTFGKQINRFRQVDDKLIPPLMVHVCKKNLPADVPNIDDVITVITNGDNTNIYRDPNKYMNSDFNVPNQPNLNFDHPTTSMRITNPHTIADMHYWHKDWEQSKLVISTVVVNEVVDEVTEYPAYNYCNV